MALGRNSLIARKVSLSSPKSFSFFKNLGWKDNYSIPVLSQSYQMSLPVLDDPFTVAELRRVLCRLSSHTSSGDSVVSVNLLKRLLYDNQFCDMVAKALYHVYYTAEIPQSWLVGILTPIPKQGKEPKVENLRPITVTPILLRILSSILAARLELWSGLNDDQAGFRKGRGVCDQVFILRVLAERSLARR